MRLRKYVHISPMFQTRLERAANGWCVLYCRVAYIIYIYINTPPQLASALRPIPSALVSSLWRGAWKPLVKMSDMFCSEGT